MRQNMMTFTAAIATVELHPKASWLWPPNTTGISHSVPNIHTDKFRANRDRQGKVTAKEVLASSAAVLDVEV
ncbi:MAG: hypothetical protein IPK92_21865 [Nitrospira sp.]|nr:hypothetical protein [Nitrospira sp.]